MGETTGIQWTQRTWNPWQGCQKVSDGCLNCYMFRDKIRFGQNPEEVVRSKPPTFNAPLRWQREAEKAGRVELVFVASWADFFSHEADPWRAEAWEIIRRCPNLVFQVLTKRHARIAGRLPHDWGDGYPNVWLGVSAEDHDWFLRRVSALTDVPAALRFVSYEPALGPLGNVSLKGIDWLIVGGESGRDARSFYVEWARDVVALGRRDRCPIFVKQFGARPFAPSLDAAGPTGLPVRLRLRDPHGGDWSEWPADLRVREFPPMVGTSTMPIPFGGP